MVLKVRDGIKTDFVRSIGGTLDLKTLGLAIARGDYVRDDHDDPYLAIRKFGKNPGIDNGTPKLFETDPTGIYFQYRATVIGEGEPEIEETLNKEYRPDLTIDEGLKIALGALYKFLGKNFNTERIDAAFIKTADKKIMHLAKDKLDKIAREIKKGK